MTFQSTLSTALVGFCLAFYAATAPADAPLKKKLGLSTEQARQVQMIRKEYRRPFAAKRGELHKERRKLRRARSDNDSATIRKQEAITDKLQKELQQIRLQENQKIRTVLNPDQKAQFEQIIEQRRKAVGSSRDAREMRKKK